MINTDDPAMFDANLAGEFENLVTYFGLEEPALKRLSLAVIEASWADDATRDRLTRDIEEWWGTGSMAQ